MHHGRRENQQEEKAKATYHRGDWDRVNTVPKLGFRIAVLPEERLKEGEREVKEWEKGRVGEWGISVGKSKSMASHELGLMRAVRVLRLPMS